MMEYFPELTRIVSVTAITQGTYVKGEWVPGTTEPQADIRMVVMPLTPGSLKNLPEGKYTAQDKKFYHKSMDEFREGTVFVLGGESYEVKEVTDRRTEGGFMLYMGKRIIKND